MCVNSTCSELLPLLSPLSFSLYLALFFSFLCIAGGLSFCVSGSLGASHGCVSVCCYFSLSFLCFSCVFLFLSWSLCLFLHLSVCVSLFLCMSLSVFLRVSPLSSPRSIHTSFSISAPFSPSLTPLLPAHCSQRLACPHRRRFRGTCAERLSWGTFDGLER